MENIKRGYCNGSDMLVYVNDQATGHSTTHSTSCQSETKEHAVKPPAIKGISSGKFKGKTVTGLSISVSAEGMVFYGESEAGYKALFKAWKAGQSVKLKCMERGNSDKPYLAGNFVIASLERTDPANDDSTYSVSFENDGEPDTLDETALTEEPEAEQG